MTHLRCLSLPLQLASHVHQASKIARQQQVGTCILNISSFLADNLVGYIGIFDTKRTAKPAANVRVFHFLDLDPFDHVQQFAGLSGYAQFAKAGA